MHFSERQNHALPPLSHYLFCLFLFFLIVPRAILAADTKSTLSQTTITQPTHAWHWYRGALHTHTLWSDGNAYPEVAAKWYKEHDFQFVALTDHDICPSQTQWSNANRGGSPALSMYADQFPNWIETRQSDSGLSVRLRMLSEFRGLLEVPGKFLLLPGEEITDSYNNKAIHIGIVNASSTIKRQRGENPLAVLQNNVQAIRDEETSSGQSVIANFCHPLIDTMVSAYDIAHTIGLNTMEIYNGNPVGGTLNNGVGDNIEGMWDRVNTTRVGELNLPLVYGTATDDSHDYQTFPSANGNPGRGAVVVRSMWLGPGAITRAIKTGNFYSTSGLELADISSTPDELTISIQGEAGVEYTTSFIGTPRNYRNLDESAIGRVMNTVKGTTAKYQFNGNELYVRARIDSTKLKSNPMYTGETETAWTQPILSRQVIATPDGTAVKVWEGYAAN